MDHLTPLTPLRARYLYRRLLQLEQYDTELLGALLGHFWPGLRLEGGRGRSALPTTAPTPPGY